MINGNLVFRHQANPVSAYDADQQALALAPATQLQVNFIRVLGTVENGWDWFSNADWTASLANLHNTLLTVKAGHFEGICVDPEPYAAYGFNGWDYAQQPSSGTRSFAEMRAQVRLRGASFIQQIQTDAPGSKVLFTGLLSLLQDLVYEGGVPRSSIDPAALQGHRYGLLASFLDGLLDGIQPGTILVDGNESSYYYQSASDFDHGRALVSEDALILVDAANRSTYQARVQVGMAVYLDGVMALANSSYPAYLGYYLADDEERQQYLLQNTYHALRTSEGLVWIYSDGKGGLDWWTPSVPAAIPATLNSALALQGRSLGFDFTPIRQAANARKLVLSGQVLDSNANPLSGVSFAVTTQGGTDKIYCTATDTSGNFACYIKTGWSGTLTPVLAGRTFTPTNRSYASENTSRNGQNFVAQ